MNKIERDRTLALAGIFQAVYLVQQVARQGDNDNQALETCINSIFSLEADNAEAVYGDASQLKLGLQILQGITHLQHSPANQELVHYAVALMSLERQLIKRSRIVETLQAGIARAQEQASFFSSTHRNVIANLAGLYTDTMNALAPKLLICGEAEHLGNPGNLNKIRALLLAGLRSVVLWRQRRGNNMRIIFGRNASARCANQILAETYGRGLALRS